MKNLNLRPFEANCQNPPNPKERNPVEAEFDQVAPEYETNRLSVWYKAHAGFILQMLNDFPPGSILDIGCGTGWLLRQIAKFKKPAKGIGIDISSNMIETAKKLAEMENIDNLEFIQGDWENMDLSSLVNKKITIILCASAFHYFSDPTAAAIRMYASLSHGGHFYLLERDKSDSRMTVIWDILHKFIIKDHVQFYHLKEIVNCFEKAGFSNIGMHKKIRRIFWKKKLYTSLVLLSGHKE